MKSVIEKIPPCPDGRSDCEFEIREAIRTQKPFFPRWNRAGELVEQDENETVGVLECSKCQRRYEYRYRQAMEAATVKEITEDPEEFPDDLEPRKERFEREKQASEAKKAKDKKPTKASE